MNIKELIPPYFYKIKSRKKQFASYEDAIEFLQNQSYEDKDLCKVVAEKTKAYRTTLLMKDLDDLDFFLLSVISSYLQKTEKKTITVVDFGGACGIHYFTMQKLLDNSNTNFKWIVVETAEMVNAAKQAGLENDNLRFVNNLSDITESVDILHSSGTIHYVSKPFEFLQKMMELKPKYLAFNRTYLIEQEDIETVFIQTSMLSHNGVGKLPSNFQDKIIKYPCTIFSLNKFTKAIDNHSYQLKFSVKQPNERSFLCGMKINKIALLYEIKER